MAWQTIVCKPEEFCNSVGATLETIPSRKNEW